jgi:protein phosphatase
MADDDDSRAGPLKAFSPLLGPYPFPPLSATVQVDVGAHTRQGTSRPTNADHYLIIRLGRSQETLRSSLTDDDIVNGFEERGYVMVVADGMGGTGSGEKASRIALLTLAHLVSAFGQWSLRIDDQVAQEIIGRAERFYRHVDAALIREGLETASDLRTTMTATFGAGRDLFFAHVGHSRAYLFRQGLLMRLTHDHSTAGKAPSPVPMAPLVDVTQAASGFEHELTSALGMRESLGLRIDLERFQLDDGDVILVCTNGVTDAVDEDRLGAVLGSGRSADDTCRTLVEIASSLDGTDDATALVARYRIPEKGLRW